MEKRVEKSECSNVRLIMMCAQTFQYSNIDRAMKTKTFVHNGIPLQSHYLLLLLFFYLISSKLLLNWTESGWWRSARFRVVSLFFGVIIIHEIWNWIFFSLYCVCLCKCNYQGLAQTTTKRTWKREKNRYGRGTWVLFIVQIFNARSCGVFCVRVCALFTNWKGNISTLNTIDT